MRWGVPIAALAVIAAAVGTGPVIAAVQGDPALPERTAEQLLADVARSGLSGGMPPMSGTVLQTSSLGLPALPAGTTDPASPLSLLSGAHEVKVWYGGADRQRIALLGRMSESNLIRNGDQVWLYESSGNTATRLKIADSLLREHGNLATPPTAKAVPTDLTPQAFAAQAIDAIDDQTTIGVSSDVKVADRPAYQLTLAPKSADSLVKEIRIALDGENRVPLRFQVYAKDSIEPAFEFGYTSVTFTPPAPENFTFTPPAGAKVQERTIGERELAEAAKGLGEDDAHAGSLPEGLTVQGDGWTSVAVMRVSPGDLQGRGGEGDANNVAQSVLSAAKQVSGPWGSGRLVRTKLITVLLTDDGRMLAGAVRPEVLYEAAGRK
ncbi:DUF2092 domain-containing protein [Spongiactinospora sp. TRM90649]|uniref:LolA family protein n=1 Tax=Spongiactinospora sp. TRM90649 TaxID=3031114 RepID=UPI0023F8D153|nr:DUF2092 domain-containing protein [Spongiactinospora sp. TRM90649]MDF5753907.1 DUF2092 domain-containing protein [Spongiactinospora sp. TRM90649]